MAISKILTVDEVNFNGGIFLPTDSDYLTVKGTVIEAIYPDPETVEFRLMWSDRIQGNILRDDGTTYIHAFVKRIDGTWKVYIQKEAGWQSFVESKEEAEDILEFISEQSYAIDPPPNNA